MISIDAYGSRLLERCRKLDLGLLGQKAERLGPNDAQLTMAMLGTLLAKPTATRARITPQ